MLAALLCACGGGGDDGNAAPGADEGGGGDVIPSYRASGTVADFATGLALEGELSLSSTGLRPPPSIDVDGAEFSISGIPANSVFHVLASSPPAYANTYAEAIAVGDADLEGITLHVVPTGFIDEAALAFGVEPSATNGVLLARALDASGQALAGVPAAAFEINGAAPVAGPFFLDAQLDPDAALTETSASGYAVFFELSPGLVALGAAPASGLSLEMASSPIASGGVTLAAVTVRDADATVPGEVSFAGDVVPMLERRGCDACHSGNGIGRDLGGLTLDGSPNKIYREITEELSPNYRTLRIDLAAPATSLMLTLPSAENPADSHPNVTFASPADPDYQILLAWITAGALDN